MIKRATNLTSSSPSAISKAFKINTKSTCFLCLRDIDGDSWAMDEDGCLIDNKPSYDKQQNLCYNLRPVFRLTQLSVKTLINLVNKEIENSDVNIREMVSTQNISVSLCKGCGNIVETLDKLWRQLELIRLQVKGKLTEFTEVLQDSLEDKERTELFRILLNDQLKDYKVADLIRNQIKSKCKSTLNKDPPYVSLVNFTKTGQLSQRLPPKKVEIPVSKSRLVSRITFQQLFQDNLSQHKETKHIVTTNPSPVRTKARKPLTPKRSARKRHSQKPSSVQSCICEKCGKTFNSYFNMKRHQNHNCPFGPQLKAPGRISKCPVCPKVYRHTSPLHRHLQKMHPSVYIKKQEKNLKMRAYQFKCNECGRLFGLRGSWEQHKKDGCSYLGGELEGEMMGKKRSLVVLEEKEPLVVSKVEVVESEDERMEIHGFVDESEEAVEDTTLEQTGWKQGGIAIKEEETGIIISNAVSIVHYRE